MDLAKAMPQFKCHKTVRALKIANCGWSADGDYMIDPGLEGWGPFPVPKEWAERHQPQPGGYCVVYEDGYTSYSPASAFESGYTPVTPAEPELEKTVEFRTGVFDADKLHEMFVYHPPTAQARELHNLINDATEKLAKGFNDCLPASAEVTLAIRALQEARFWANSAVAMYVTAGVPAR